MCFNTITYEMKLPIDQDLNLLPVTEAAALPGEGPLGTIRLSHASKVFENDTTFRMKHSTAFLGFCFNLGDKITSIVHGRKVTLHRNHYNLVYLPPNSDLIYDVTEGVYTIFSIELSQAYLQVWAELFPLLRPFLESRVTTIIHPHNLLITPELQRLIKDILYSPYTGFSRDTYFYCRFNDIVVYCLENITENQDHRNWRNQHADELKVRKAQELLAKDIRLDWSIDLLASKVNMERSKLTRTFRRVFGKSVMEYLIALRMDKAKALLRDSDMLIKQIAHTIGYKNASNFSEAFKRHFGYAPVSLRQGDDEDTEN